MVHKSSNQALKDITLDNINKPHSQGIHKYNSTSSWLDEYDRAVDKINKELDKEYEESAKRQKEAEERISKLQAEEEYEREMEEERSHKEQMRQLELERARAEIDAIKEQVKGYKKPSQPIPVERVEEVKPTLKQRLVKVAKTIGGIAGAVTGHPEVSVASGLVPEPEGKKVQKTVYKQPKYEDDYLIYGSWR